MRKALVLAIFVCLAAPAVAGAQQAFPLTISMSGTDFGGISIQSSDGLTFSCLWEPGNPAPLCAPTSGTASIASGAVVTVSAGTNRSDGFAPGLLFAGSGPAAACTLSACRFTMTGAASFGVDFSAANGPAAALAILLAGDGTGSVDAQSRVCQNVNAALPTTNPGCAQASPYYYLHGSTIRLSASPGPAARFAGYTNNAGALSSCGASADCDVTLSASMTVSATFRALVSIAVSPSLATAPVGGPPRSFTPSARSPTA